MGPTEVEATGQGSIRPPNQRTLTLRLACLRIHIPFGIWQVRVVILTVGGSIKAE